MNDHLAAIPGAIPGAMPSAIPGAVPATMPDCGDRHHERVALRRHLAQLRVAMGAKTAPISWARSTPASSRSSPRRPPLTKMVS